MPRLILARGLLAAIEISARVIPPFCAGLCKRLFWRRVFGCGAAVFFLGLALAGCAGGAEPPARAPAPQAVPAQQSERQGAPQGTPQCNRHDEALAILERRYGESPVSGGVTHRGGLVTVLESPGGATWSILITTPPGGPMGGWACLVAAGEGWRTLTAALPGEPS